jgi:hypothetical protein
MFFKKRRGRCGCVYGTKGAVDRKFWEPLDYGFDDRRTTDLSLLQSVRPA